MKMGKIYLNINAGSNSIDYDSPRFLGFAKPRFLGFAKEKRGIHINKLEITIG